MSSGPANQSGSVDFTKLDKPSCEQLLFKLKGSRVFGGIERGGFTAALLGGEHFNLFSDGEVQQLSNAADNSDLFKPILSACQRLGGVVLQAMYDTLLSTRDAPGAVQHGSIAGKLQECVQSLARPVARPTTATYTDSTHQQDRFQGGTAEQDLGLPKTDQNQVTSKYGYTAKDEQSHHGCYQSGSTTANTGGVRVPSMTSGRRTHKHSNTAPSLGDQGTEDNEQNEPDTSSLDWNSKEYVAMFTDYLVDRMDKQEYQALANEILANRPPSKKDDVKKQIHTAVLHNDISLYQIGRFLLVRQELFRYIFIITEFTNAPITARVKEILRDHLGQLWEQLALGMGMTRSRIHDLKIKIPTISSQIDNFLSEKLQFPRLPTMEQTASLLVEIMGRASLPEVAKDVRRGFLSIFDLKEDDVYPGRSDVYQPVDVRNVMHGGDECEETSSGTPGESDPRSIPPSPPKTKRDKTSDAPGSSLTAQNNPPIPKSPQIAHGLDNQQPVGPRIIKSNSDSDVPPARSEVPSVTPQPPGEPTKQAATSESVPPSADNLPQQHKSAPLLNTASGVGMGDKECISENSRKSVNTETFETSEEDSSKIMETVVEDIEVCEDDKSEEELLSHLADLVWCMSPIRRRDKKQIVHFAAELGHVQLLRQVLAAGHNGRAVMERGMTPFLLACEAGKVDIVKALHQQYEEVILFEKDDCERTCLHFPEVYRNKELFQFLIWDSSADANATSESNTGVTPLSVACLAGGVQEVNELLVKISPPAEPKRPSRMPPLHCAALSNNYAVLKYLVEQDYPYFSDPDSKSDDGYTPLHIAAARGNMDIVQYLVEVASCSVNVTSANGSTALLLAAMCNHAEIAQYLINRGAGLDYNREIRKGLYHITPLGEAVLGRNVDVSIVLIENGADIFFKSGGTTSILDHACIGGNEQIVQMLISKLLESSYDQTNKMNMFRSAFQVSVDFNDLKIAKLIVETVQRELDVSTAEEVFEKFKGKSELGLNNPLIKAINQYKQMMEIYYSDLPNEGDTCRRVAGGRNTVLYHIGYDDGPHWGTEMMHIPLLFEDLRKHERFRTVYKRVYMEATKCVINNVITFNEASWDSLAGEAQSNGNPSAVQFYSNPKLQSRYADPELFIHLGHAGVPSAINMACSIVSQNMIQEGFGLHGLTADQYFAEVIKRDKEHPGTFGLKYQCPGNEPAGGIRLRGDSTVQSGRQQSYTSRQPPASRGTSSSSWKSQSGGYMSGTTPGSGGQRITSSGSGGGQRQVGTPSDSGWQSQSLWEAMSKGNTSSSSTRQSLDGERQLELTPGGGGHQLNPPTDLHSSQNQSSLTSSSSLNPPSTSSTLLKSSTFTNVTSPNTSTTTCTDNLTNTSPSLTAAHKTPPSTQHTGFGRQDPSINTEMPQQQFDNPADPQSIPREPGSTTTGEQSHLSSGLSAGTGNVPNGVSTDKVSKSMFSEGTHTEHTGENPSVPPPPSLPSTGQDEGSKSSGRIPLISPSPNRESINHKSFQSVQSAFKMNMQEDQQDQSNHIPPSYANEQQQTVRPTNPSKSKSLKRSNSVPSNLSSQVSNPIESDNGQSTDHLAKQRDPQQIDSPDIPIMPVQCTEEVTEAHLVMPNGKSVIMPYGEYLKQPAPYDNPNEQTLENSKPPQPNPDEGDSEELSPHPHSHTEGLIGGQPQDPVPNDPHGNNKGSELSTGKSPHHNSSHGVADASLPRSTHPVSSNPSVSLSASTKDILEKDSVTKSPSQSEVVVEKTFEDTLPPEHLPSTLKISIPDYGERSLSNPQVRNSSSPRPSTYGGDEKFDKPIQLPQTTMTTTTTTTTLSQQQQVSSTISNGTSPPQSSLKSNDSQKSSEDSFLSESPHTSKLPSSKDDPGTTSTDTIDQPCQPLVNASVDPDSRDLDHSSFQTRTKRSFDNTTDSEESGTSPAIHQKPVPVSNGSKPVQPNPTGTGNSDTLPTTLTGSTEHVHPRSNTDEERESLIEAQLSLQPSVLQPKNKPSPSQKSLGSSDPHSSQTHWSMSASRPPKPVYQSQRPPSSSVHVDSHPSQQVEDENDDNDGNDDDDARSIMSGSSIHTSGNTDLPLWAQQQQQQVAQQQHQVAQQQQHDMWLQSQEPKAWLNSPEQAQFQQQQQKQQQEVWPQSRQQVQHQQHHMNLPLEQQPQEVKDSVSTTQRYPPITPESRGRPERDTPVDESQLSLKELFSENSENSVSSHTVVNSLDSYHTMEGSREEEATDSTEGFTSMNLQTPEGNQSDLDPSTPLVEDGAFTTVHTKFDMSIDDTLDALSQQQQQQKQQQQQQQQHAQQFQAEYPSQGNSYSSNEQDHFLPSNKQGHFLPSNEQSRFLPSNGQVHVLPSTEQGHFLPSNVQEDFLPSHEKGHFLPSNGQGDFLSSNEHAHFLPSNEQGHFLPSNGQVHVLPSNEQGSFMPSIGQGRFLPSNEQGHFLPFNGQSHFLPSDEQDRLLSFSRSMPSQDTSTLQDVSYSLLSPNHPQLSGSHEGPIFPSPPRPEMPPPTLTGNGTPGMYPGGPSMAHPLAITHSSWVTTPSMATHTDSHMQSVSTHLPQPAYPLERQQSAGPLYNTHLSVITTTTTAFCSPLVHQQSSKDSGIVDFSSMENGSIGGLRSQNSYQLPHQGSSLDADLFQGTAENQPTLTTQKSHTLHRQECVVGNGMHTNPRVDSTEYSDLPLKEAEGDDDDDQILRLVARQVNRKWTMLARYAGVQEDQITEIKKAHQNVGERSMTLLRELKKRGDWKERLIHLLRRMRMNLTADELQGWEAPPSCALLQNVDMVQHMVFLRDLTSSIGEHWKELAVQLSVNWKERFDVTRHQPKENSCLEVIQMWLESSTSPKSFRHLLMAVEAVTVSCDVLKLLETVQPS